MRIDSKTPDEYIAQLPEERQQVLKNLRKVITDNLPKGFEETISYGMIGYVIPHSIYPAGYHVDPKLPLPFVSVASQKEYVALYHMGLYADENLLAWFKNEYPKYSKKKLDMGKSCIRFKDFNSIPYPLIGELLNKISVEEWIKRYETLVKKK